MEIVIKIPEEDYKNGTLINCFKCYSIELDKIIYSGTPLPKGHGRLIDADWVKNTLDIYVLNEYNGQFIRRSDIDSIPTIIEADKEVQGEI